MLISIEAAGVSPVDEFNLYQQMREGKKIVIPEFKNPLEDDGGSESQEEEEKEEPEGEEE